MNLRQLAEQEFINEYNQTITIRQLQSGYIIEGTYFC